ncbi:hypothetical protein EIP91_000790 [Steccherinum ochraceum]|uniref:F-box domain-containing protein n=1 Tax=Steccherinum ochraceum TaxID=92696 RepID=A0A4R0RNN7_9APHY|nr:hypothetical protein EIP91_000790 [Steccherinum ochraceum]
MSTDTAVRAHHLISIALAADIAEFLSRSGLNIITTLVARLAGILRNADQLSCLDIHCCAVFFGLDDSFTEALTSLSGLRHLIVHDAEAGAFKMIHTLRSELISLAIYCGGLAWDKPDSTEMDFIRLCAHMGALQKLHISCPYNNFVHSGFRYHHLRELIIQVTKIEELPSPLILSQTFPCLEYFKIGVDDDDNFGEFEIEHFEDFREAMTAIQCQCSWDKLQTVIGDIVVLDVFSFRCPVRELELTTVFWHLVPTLQRLIAQTHPKILTLWISNCTSFFWYEHGMDEHHQSLLPQPQVGRLDTVVLNMGLPWQWEAPMPTFVSKLAESLENANISHIKIDFLDPTEHPLHPNTSPVEDSTYENIAKSVAASCTDLCTIAMCFSLTAVERVDCYRRIWNITRSSEGTQSMVEMSAVVHLEALRSLKDVSTSGI